MKSSIIAAIIVAFATIMGAIIANNKSQKSPSPKNIESTEITNSQVINEKKTYGNKSPIINNNNGNTVLNYN